MLQQMEEEKLIEKERKLKEAVNDLTIVEEEEGKTPRMTDASPGEQG